MIKTVDYKLFKPELSYMTKQERATFEQLLKAGAISFFRVDKCENCKMDVIKGKKYCSEECYKVVVCPEEGDDDGEEEW